MKLPTQRMNNFLGQFGLLICCLVVLGLTYYLYRCTLTAAAARTPMTTDQVLASLATIVTILGGVVAIATIGIAVFAFYGYGELRTATFRKTEDDLIAIIRALEDSGRFNSAAAGILMQGVAAKHVILVPVPKQEPDSTGAASNLADQQPKRGSKIAEKYPGDV